MLTEGGLKKGRVLVLTAEDYIKRTKGDERYAQGFDFALAGLCSHGPITFPYPGMNDGVVMLRRDQAAHMVVEVLKGLAPDGELPTDAAELLDFVATVIRDGSAPA